LEKVRIPRRKNVYVAREKVIVQGGEESRVSQEGGATGAKIDETEGGSGKKRQKGGGRRTERRYFKREGAVGQVFL